MNNKNNNIEFHELANLFPMMNDEEKTQLEESIKNGFDENFPILLYENKILDGRNRYQACMNTGTEPVFKEWVGDNPLNFVIKANLERRHLSSSQKAMMALDYEDVLVKKAKENQGKRNDLLQKIVNNKEIPSTALQKLLELESTDSNFVEIFPQSKPAEDSNFCQRIDISSGGRVTEQLAQMVGTNRQYVSDAKSIQTKAPDLAKRVRSGEITIPEAKAEIKKQERTAYIAQQKEDIATGKAVLPSGKYEIIVMDPPWEYGTEYNPQGRRSASPYPEMNLEDIGNIELPASNDCVLWLWTTHKFMKHSFDLLDKWGFRDVAILTWVKDRMGLGSWLRSQSEFCIMAVRGKPIINLTNQTTILNGKMREHSRKPDEFYSMVDELCVGRKLDYFSRENRDGWDSYGNDIDKFGGVG